MAASPPASRDERIDTVRGLACVLLVAYHVVGANETVGMRVPPDSGYRWTSDLLAYLRLPLFTFLSGVVYARRPVERGRALRFVRAKALRLLLPLIFVGLLFAVVQRLVPGSSMKLEWRQMPLIPIYPYAHFWFLQALFVVFLIVAALELGGLLKDRARTAAMIGLAALGFYLSGQLPRFFALSQAFYLLPFFLTGLAVSRFSSRWLPVLIEICIAAAAASAVCLLAGFGPLDTAARLLVPLVTGTLLIRYLPPLRWLAFIGAYAYTIYLFHVFGTAGARIALSALFDPPAVLIFVLGTIAGLAVPIAVHLALRRVPYASRAFLGIRAETATAPARPSEPTKNRA